MLGLRTHSRMATQSPHIHLRGGYRGHKVDRASSQTCPSSATTHFQCIVPHQGWRRIPSSRLYVHVDPMGMSKLPGEALHVAHFAVSKLFVGSHQQQDVDQCSMNMIPLPCLEIALDGLHSLTTTGRIKAPRGASRSYSSPSVDGDPALEHARLSGPATG